MACSQRQYIFKDKNLNNKSCQCKENTCTKLEKTYKNTRSKNVYLNIRRLALIYSNAGKIGLLKNVLSAFEISNTDD